LELIKYEQAINKLKLDKKHPINNDVFIDPRFGLDWVRGKDFTTLFLPFLKLKIEIKHLSITTTNRKDTSNNNYRNDKPNTNSNELLK